MQMKTKHFAESFSKNTFYRFVNDAGINQVRFTTLLARSIIENFFKPLTSEDRADVYVGSLSYHAIPDYTQRQVAQEKNTEKY